MMRLNITLPDEIAKKLAGKHNKSRFIAEALREKLEREKQKRIEHLLVEGYKAAAKEDAAVHTDWKDAEVEGWE
ncbi:MAG: hypothetical protein ABH836_00670 [Candidatus Omnitrophota bacterium]